MYFTPSVHPGPVYRVGDTLITLEQAANPGITISKDTPVNEQVELGDPLKEKPPLPGNIPQFRVAPWERLNCPSIMRPKIA